MRIAVGQLWQETNTFNPIPTTYDDFETFGIDEGADLVEKMAHTNELGGFIQSLMQWPEKPEIVGLVRLPAWPAGTLTAEGCDRLMERMRHALERAGKVDAVLLALHGSLVADQTPDVEGRLLELVRGRVGASVPIVASLDLHANVTQRMVRNADALVLYHTTPHIDVMPTGRRAAQVLRRILVEGAKPVTAFQKVPMVVPAERANTQDPTSFSFQFRQWLEACEKEPGILTAGLATVQPWLDIPELGSAVLVVADGNALLAEARCRYLAHQLWQHRQEYFMKLMEVTDAVRRANELQPGLVVLGDGADATTSGSPGDSTAILSELVKYDWPKPALLTLVAPNIVSQAEARGAGADWEVTLGGVRDSRFSKPFTLKVKVGKIFDAKFVLSGHLAEKLPIDMGRSVVLAHGNIKIIVTSRSGPHFAPALFQAAGFDPLDASVLVAKSPCGFRAAYTAHAKEIMMVRAPGCAPHDFWKYPYDQIDRPLWPWDEIADWTPQPTMVGS